MSNEQGSVPRAVAETKVSCSCASRPHAQRLLILLINKFSTVLVPVLLINLEYEY